MVSKLCRIVLPTVLYLPVSALAVQSLNVSGLGQPQPKQIFVLSIPGGTDTEISDEDGDGVIVIDPPSGQDFQIQRLGSSGNPVGQSLVGTIPNRAEFGSPNLQQAFSIANGDQVSLISAYDRLATNGQYHVLAGDNVFSFLVDPVAPAGSGNLKGANQLGAHDPTRFSINVYDATTGEYTGGVTSPTGSNQFLISDGFQPQDARLPGSKSGNLQVGVGRGGGRSWVGLRGGFNGVKVGTQWSPYYDVAGRADIFNSTGWNNYKPSPSAAASTAPDPLLSASGKTYNGLEVLGHILAGQDLPGNLQQGPPTNIESITTQLPGPSTRFQGPRAVINAGFLNIRTGPGIDNQVTSTLPGGSELAVIGKSADGVWYQVDLPGGGNGWLNSNFVLFRGDASLIPIIDETSPTNLNAAPEVGLVVDKLSDIPQLAASYNLQVNDPITQLPNGGFLLSGTGTQPRDELVNLLNNDPAINFAAPSFCHDMYPLRRSLHAANAVISVVAANPPLSNPVLGGRPLQGSPGDGTLLRYDYSMDDFSIDPRSGSGIQLDPSQGSGGIGQFKADPGVDASLAWSPADAGYGAGDIAAANAALEAAGYTRNADGIFEHPSDGPLSPRVGSTGGNRLREIQQELIQAQMADAGLDFFSEGLGDPIMEADIGWTQQTANPCTDGNSTLCLNDNRFTLDVDWKDFEGNTGPGRGVELGNDDSGLFYFFDPNNWETLIKVLDGCQINNHFWVFAAATTSVEFTLTVTDTQSGSPRQYTNPLGNAFEPILDTEAFATCP